MRHPCIRLLLATFVSLSLPATVLAFPLTKDESGCATSFLKDSRKVVGACGKATASCVSDIGREKAAVTDPALCAAQDNGGKLDQALQKQRAKVDKKCLDRPSPLDCGEPCEATDAGGSTAAINDAAELADCLECLSPATSIAVAAPVPLERGAHGRVLAGLALATRSSDLALSRCQAAVVKRYEKMFAAELEQVNGCAKKALKDDGPVRSRSVCWLERRSGSDQLPLRSC